MIGEGAVMRYAAVLFLLWLGGCAFGDRHVTLAYPPAPNVEVSTATATAAEAEAPTAVPKIGRTIVLQPPVETRTFKQVVGIIRNGVGMHTADVIADNDVAAWIATALRMEFEAAGYAVAEPAEGQASNAPVLECRIVLVRATALSSYRGRVAFLAVVKKDGKEIFNKSYDTQKSAGTNWVASGAGFAEALSLALAAAARELAADVKNAGI